MTLAERYVTSAVVPSPHVCVQQSQLMHSTLTVRHAGCGDGFLGRFVPPALLRSQPLDSVWEDRFRANVPPPPRPRSAACLLHCLLVVLGLAQGRDATLRFRKQPSFELGVIGYYLCAEESPVLDYVALRRDLSGYSAADLTPLPSLGGFQYPVKFTTLLQSLVQCNPGETDVVVDGCCG